MVDSGGMLMNPDERLTWTERLSQAQGNYLNARRALKREPSSLKQQLLEQAEAELDRLQALFEAHRRELAH
jgi:hypothetical protein|tara:strand:- start:15 stop:227 length:213 start_codon:yes stop_codon:yes gene_type:complete